MSIKVSDYTIYTPVNDILSLLRIETADNGVLLFDSIKQTGSNFMTNCPFHKGGKERKPSFGISKDGECHCFACGWSSSSFEVFVSAVFGYEDNGEFGRAWLLKHLSSIFQERQPIEITFKRGNQKSEKVTISEAELDEYRYTHPYLYQRGLTDELILRFDIGYDPKRLCVTFPVKDLEGDVVFVATRSVNSKFFTLPEGENKPVYGAYLFRSGEYSTCVITEAFFDSLTLWKYGIPSVALMGTGSSYQLEILKKLPVRHYIIGLDPDEAGKRGDNRIRKALTGYKLLSKYTLPEGTDINDLGDKILSLQPVLV